MTMQERIDALREALEQIRDVADISEGVEWYAMIADAALVVDDRNASKTRQAEDMRISWSFQAK
jgi:hypothetical protein